MLPLHQPGLLDCRFASARVPAREGLRLDVAVRAEHPEIFQPVVVPNAVSMIDLDGQGLPPPAVQAAFIADVPEYTSLDQAPFDGAPVAAPGQDLLDGPAPGTRPHAPPADRLGPGHQREAEPLAAVTDRVAGIVVLLHGRPIVACRHRRGAKAPPPDRLVPSCQLESEALAARVPIVAGIVVCLHGSPIVCAHVANVAEGRATGVART